MRLDKFLADAGEGTRKEVKDMVKRGRILVNSETAKDPGMQVSAEDEVLCDGRRIAAEQYVYLMLNKPAGVISATEDPREKTVLDLIEKPCPKGLAPVGRLDKDTVGLLLLTNDGALAHRLLSPKKHVDKTYLARVTGQVSAEDVEAFRAGVVLSDFTCMPAELTVVAPPKMEGSGSTVTAGEGADFEAVKQEDGFTWAEVTIREGKFHQIKRMFHARGKEVVYLKRLSMGPLLLDESLPEGGYRELSSEEKKLLFGGIYEGNS